MSLYFLPYLNKRDSIVGFSRVHTRALHFNFDYLHSKHFEYSLKYLIKNVENKKILIDINDNRNVTNIFTLLFLSLSLSVLTESFSSIEI